VAFDLTQKAFEKLRDPEPEPNWRSLYEAEKAAHGETKQALTDLRVTYDELMNDWIELGDK
jgi:hypothetical protein